MARRCSCKEGLSPGGIFVLGLLALTILGICCNTRRRPLPSEGTTPPRDPPSQPANENITDISNLRLFGFGLFYLLILGIAFWQTFGQPFEITKATRGQPLYEFYNGSLVVLTLLLGVFVGLSTALLARSSWFRILTGGGWLIGIAYLIAINYRNPAMDYELALATFLYAAVYAWQSTRRTRHPPQ